MKHGLLIAIVLLFSKNAGSQIVDQAEFTGALESTEYTKITCQMPSQIYEGRVFRTTFVATPKGHSQSGLNIQHYYARFLDSTLFLCTDSSALEFVSFSGYLNETSLTLLSPTLAFANAKTYPVVLTLQNEKFIMHDSAVEGSENFPVLAEESIMNVEETIEVVEAGEPYDAYMCDPAASFPGGDSAMFKFIMTHITYPPELISSGISGKVYVRFTINTDGSISDITVLKGVHKALDQEAIRVVSMMPKWNPGMINGKVVRSTFVLPLVFSIE